MNDYTPYTMTRILARRAFVIAAGVLALPVMLFRADRARFYSYLHRVWMKTSDKPVWLSHAEMATQDFTDLAPSPAKGEEPETPFPAGFFIACR